MRLPAPQLLPSASCFAQAHYSPLGRCRDKMAASSVCRAAGRVLLRGPHPCVSRCGDTGAAVGRLGAGKDGWGSGRAGSSAALCGGMAEFSPYLGPEGHGDGWAARGGWEPRMREGRAHRPGPTTCPVVCVLEACEAEERCWLVLRAFISGGPAASDKEPRYRHLRADTPEHP